MFATIRRALGMAVLLAAANAHAESEPADAGGGYRWQVAATDAGVIAAAAAGFALEGRGFLDNVPSNMLMGVASAGYFLGAPVVHLAHREYGRAGISIILRVGLPIVGGAIGARLASCSRDEWLCGLDEFAKGFALGAVTAAIVDSAFVAPGSPSHVEPDRVVARRPPPAVRLSPRLVAAPNVALLGVGGSF
jgi:hypothetical protein